LELGEEEFKPKIDETNSFKAEKIRAILSTEWKYEKRKKIRQNVM
jgi:hypothetical protein